ncbi:hypothetical protein DXG01_017003 [Tephrocybe rancida]|nr:hypothetical protein DXG01_017003 [Tephrocybe rancida]
MKRGFLNAKAKKSTKEPTPTSDVIHAADRPGAIELGEPCPPGQIGYKLPIGKVDTTLPENYVVERPEYAILDADTVNYDEHLVFTTIPSRTFEETSASSPDTWSECLLQGGKHKRSILDTPGFPAPVPKPPQSRHRIGPSAYGVGMFATKDLVPNDLIVAERPILVFPASMPMTQSSATTYEQAVQVHLAEVEQQLKICVDRMLPESRAAYYELHNCHTEDGSGPILGRARTNGIEIGLPVPGINPSDKGLFRTSGVFDAISRANHSCAPNAAYKFNVPSFSLSLRAVRPIKAGEEITITYCHQTKPKAQRQAELLPYGFQCTCARCSDPSSDALLARILESTKPKAGDTPDRMLRSSIQWIKIIEDAKLELLHTYFLHLFQIVMWSRVMGKVAYVKKYEPICEAWCSTVEGESFKSKSKSTVDPQWLVIIPASLTYPTARPLSLHLSPRETHYQFTMAKGKKKSKKPKKMQEVPPATSASTDTIQADNIERVQLNPNFVGLKMPIGAVDTTLPEDYVYEPPPCLVLDANIDHGDDIGFIFTTIPAQRIDHTLANNPDGWAECFLRSGKQKRAILAAPGYPAPVPKPPQTRHRIGPSKHGMGMFATKDLVPNDLIVAERPLLVYPPLLTISEQLLSSYTPAQAIQVHLAQTEEYLKIIVDRMVPERRAAYLELHNCHTEDGSGPIMGIARTNGIDLKIPISAGVNESEKDLLRAAGVYDTISRINHSCTPNASWNFDLASFSLSVRAVRPIKAGEEIFISYCEIAVPKAERQASLRPYGFQCTCTACTDPGSDALLARIKRSTEVIHPNSLDADTLNAWLQDNIRWIKIIQDAKWECLNDYFIHLMQATRRARRLEKPAHVRKYEAMCEAWHLAMRGESVNKRYGHLGL